MTTTKELTKQEIWDQLEAEDEAKAPKTEAPTESAVRHEPEEQAPAAADAMPQETATNDAPDPIKLELDGLRTMVSQLTDRLRNAEGHIGGMNNRLKDVQAAAQAAAKANERAGNDSPTREQIGAAAGNAEAMAKLKEEYPEFGALLDSTLRASLDPVLRQMAELKAAAPANNVVSIEQLERTRREMAVEIRHPGWQETVQTPQFIGWIQSQPREVQMLGDSSHPADAVRLLDLYASATRAPSSRSRSLDSAASIPGGRAAGVRAKTPDQMTDQEYWQYLESIESQKG